ncbi:MAG: immunoglobulin domain-containing protein, partial [Verrucomicrobiota bacterium]
HPTENRTFYAPAVEPSLNLSVPILHISGLDNYELPRPHLVANHLTKGQNALPNAGSGPNGTYMGKDFRAAYVPDSTLSGTGQAVGLFEFDGYNPADIAYYENAAGLPNTPLQNVLVGGASGQPNGSSADVEVALDIEMAISMATNLSSVIVYEAPPGAPFVDLLNRMASDNQVRQFSCSWYVLDGTADPTADQIWQQMAMQGQSFFNASGDSDAYTGLISFPGDTPYVTQVGGTTLTTSGPDGAWVSETVWNWGNGIGSSGGVSTQYPIPSWQTNINMTANQGSTVRRNTPDVAMTADNIYVRADGDDYSAGGTSCAAPLWAGFVALVNQQAAASGKSPIGLVNLAVDAIGTGSNYTSAFHDITTGNNTWRGSRTKFYAVSGYDLCTGWGTPAGQTLINALVNPEALIITPAAGFISVGGSGGPFTITSQVFSVTNAGTNTLHWTLSNTSAWLNVSSGGGTLIPGGPAAAVTVSLNSAASNLVVGTYSATLWFTNVNDGFGQSRQFALSIISPPAITTQPVNDSVLQGAPAGFSVQVTGGSPLFFQWQDDGTNLTDDGNISGSATSNLTINAVSPANVGTYSVIITNIAGTVTSSNALLTIIPSQPVITSQPTNLTTIIGSVAQFNVSVIGTTPYNYQWNWNGTNELTGATNAALTLNDVQLTNAGEYSVTISNLYGVTNSFEALLTVNPFGAFVVPTNLANVEGPGSSGALSAQNREQDVYGASYFPTQTIVITGIRFRPDANQSGGRAFTNTISNIQFSLSSTPTAPYQLSSTFADNIGTNVTTVFNGSLPLSSEYAGPAAGPKAFDMVVNFTTPFVYNPSSGNLLLDIQDFSGEATSYNDGGNSSSEMASRLNGVGGNATSGVADNGCSVLEIIYTVASQPPIIVTQPT